MVASVALYRLNQVDALGACESGGEFAANNQTVGSPLFFGLSPLCPHGDQPVQILEAELLGVPAGIRVHGFYAVDIRNVGSAFFSLGPEDLPRDLLRPITDMVLMPGEPEYWWLTAELSASEVGAWKATGFRVTYEVGGRRGAQEYADVVGIHGVEYGLPECLDDPEGCPEGDDDPWGNQPDCDSEYVHCVDPDDE